MQGKCRILREWRMLKLSASPRRHMQPGCTLNGCKGVYTHCLLSLLLSSSSQSPCLIPSHYELLMAGFRSPHTFLTLLKYPSASDHKRLLDTSQVLVCGPPFQELQNQVNGSLCQSFLEFRLPRFPSCGFVVVILKTETHRGKLGS